MEKIVGEWCSVCTSAVQTRKKVKGREKKAGWVKSLQEEWGPPAAFGPQWWYKRVWKEWGNELKLWELRPNRRFPMLDSATVRMSPEIWKRKWRPFSISYPLPPKTLRWQRETPTLSSHLDCFLSFDWQKQVRFQFWANCSFSGRVVLLQSALTVGQKRLEIVAVKSAAELATVLWKPSVLTSFTESRKRRTPRRVRIHCGQGKKSLWNLCKQSSELTLSPSRHFIPPLTLHLNPLLVFLRLAIVINCDWKTRSCSSLTAVIHLFSVSHLFPGSQEADVNVSLAIVRPQQLCRLRGKGSATDVIKVVHQGRRKQTDLQDVKGGESERCMWPFAIFNPLPKNYNKNIRT